MTRHRGGGPVRLTTTLMGLSVVALVACSPGARPEAAPPRPGDAAGTQDLPEARHHLADGRGVHAQFALRRLLEREDSAEARALWWAADQAGGDAAALAASPAWPTALKICVLADGDAAATGHVDGTVRVWDLSTGLPTPLRGGLPGPVEALACGPGGSVAAGGDAPSILLWDSPAATLAARPRAIGTGGAAVRRLAFHPALGVLAAALADATVGHWAPATGQEFARLRGHRGRLPGLAFSDDGRQLATWGDERALRVRRWGHEALPLRLHGHRGLIRAAVFLPGGGSLVSADDDGRLLLWDVTSGQRTPLQIGDHAGETWALALHPDGSRVASADSDGLVRLWPIDGGQPAQRLRGHLGPVRDLAFSPDGGRLVSVGPGRGIRIWDGVTGAPLLGPATRSSSTEDASVVCTLTWPEQVELTPPGLRKRIAGARAVVATPGGCAVLTDRGADMVRPDGSVSRVDPSATAVAWSRGRLLTAGPNTKLGEQTGRITAVTTGPRGAIHGLASGAVVLSDGRTLHPDAQPTEVTQLLALPADALAATFAGGQLVVWHAPTGRQLTARSLRGRPTDLRISADRRTLRVVTELGDRASLDLTPLAVRWCDLLDAVWSALPQPPRPGSHRCMPPA